MDVYPMNPRCMLLEITGARNSGFSGIPEQGFITWTQKDNSITLKSSQLGLVAWDLATPLLEPIRP